MYVVIGANGFLGSYLLRCLTEQTQESIIAVGVHVAGWQDTATIHWVKCDVTDAAAVHALASAAQLEHEDVKVVYLAAFHHPDKVEAQPRLAWDVNITALARFLNEFWFAKHLTYVSTDTVYGEGSLTHRFTEGDPPNPVNRYGRHKAIAETLVRGYGFQVVRLPFLIGPSLLPDRRHFYDEIAQAITSGQPIEMFQDAYRSALSFRQAAAYIVALMEWRGEVPDLLNLCGDEALSKYDVGVRVAQQCGVSPALIHPIAMANGSGVFAVKRATTAIMDNRLMKRTLGLTSIPFEL